jgi:MerR family transcriptional regulator, copper efflux regulator
MTIQEAASATGWSPRMLRYIEQTGLVQPVRSGSGYRLYEAAELKRLRSLKELLDRFDLGLSEIAFAARLDASTELRCAVRSWLRSGLHGDDREANFARLNRVERYDPDALLAALA